MQARLALCVVGVVFGALQVAGAEAQELVHLRSTSCSACTIALSRIVTISDSSFRIPEDPRLRVTRDRAGRFFVCGEGSQAVGLFSPAGNFIRAIGALDAPIAFRDVAAILPAAADSLYVLEASHWVNAATGSQAGGRWIVLDPDYVRIARVSSTPAFSEAAAHSDGRLLLSGRVRGSPLPRRALHLIAADGSISHSLGVEVSDSVERSPFGMYRGIARARRGGYWITLPATYTIELWSPELRHTRTLQRTSPWFQPMTSATQMRTPRFDRPPTILRSVSEDSLGILWANVGIAAEDWKPSLRSADEIHASGVVPFTEANRYVDTILEAIDSETGTVLATTRAKGILAPVVGAALLWQMRRDSAGRITIDIFEPRISR